MDVPPEALYVLLSTLLYDINLRIVMLTVFFRKVSSRQITVGHRFPIRSSNSFRFGFIPLIFHWVILLAMVQV